MQPFRTRFVSVSLCFTVLFAFAGKAFSESEEPREISGRVIDSSGAGYENIQLEFLWPPSASPTSSSVDSLRFPARTDQTGRFSISSAESAVLSESGSTQFRVDAALPADTVLALPDGTLVDPLRTGAFTKLGNSAVITLTTSKLCSDSPGVASLYGSSANIKFDGVACWACTGALCQKVLCPPGATPAAAESSENEWPLFDDPYASNMVAMFLADEVPPPNGGGTEQPECSITIWGAKWCQGCVKLKEALGCKYDPYKSKQKNADNCKSALDQAYPCMQITFVDVDEWDKQGKPRPDGLAGIPAITKIDPVTGKPVILIASAELSAIDDIAKSSDCACKRRKCVCANPKDGSASCHTEESLKKAGWKDEQLDNNPSCRKDSKCEEYAAANCTPTPSPTPESSSSSHS